MIKSKEISLLSLSDYLFRLFIVALLLVGLLPAPALAQTNGTIAGRVTDNSTGNATSGAMILVFPSGSQSPGWNGTTNATGNYSMAIPAGTDYQVAAYKAGYITVQAGGQNVSANTTTTVNFSLVPGGIIQGTVTNNSSSPIEGANVRAYKPETPGVTFTSLPSDASGHYGLTVPPGAGYIVEANKQGYASANQTSVSAAIGSPATVSFTLLPPPPPPDTTPPAAVTNLAAINPAPNSITLTWTAPGDDGNTGQASQYDIRYATSIISGNSTFNAATQVQSPPAPKTAGASENLTVFGLSANTTYFFALKTRDDVNLWSGLSNSPSANTTPAPPPPYFDIAHSGGKSSFMLGAGDNITESFNISSVNNFAGTASLSLQGPPEVQANSSLSPTQVTLAAGETRSVTMTLGASAMTPSGTYQCSLGGQTAAYGGQRKSYFFTVIVGVAGQPLLSASPAVVAAGSQTNFSASQFTPGDNVTLKWDSGPKAGQTLAAGQIAGNGTWNIPVTILADTPGGNFAVKVASAAKSALFQLTVISGLGPDFIMSSSPQFISITPGNTSNVTVLVTSVNGFNGPVALSSSSAPGVTCSLSTGNVTPATGQTASATLIITVAEWTSPNMYHINVNGSSPDPPISKMVGISLDISPPAQWGPSISLSQSYGKAGDAITVTGSNFPPSSNNQTVTIKEAVTNTQLQTTPATITVSSGSFTGTFTIPSGVPTGNYRVQALIVSTGHFAERDFQILGTGATFTLGISPESVTVTTEQGQNSASVSVNIVSVGGNSPTVNLGIDGAPPWLNYQFGSLPVSVPAGGSSSRNLTLTANMTAPTGNYPLTVKGWVTGSPEIRASLQLTVLPPAGFGMAEFALSPTFGESGRTVNFSGSGFTGCSPSQVTELRFGGLNILTGQSLPTITVASDTGRFSGTFRVPAVLAPGTYPVEIRVGSSPNDKFIGKPFTITGGSDAFVLQASPAFLWVEQGSQVNTMIQVQATGSSSATVILSLEGYPSNDIIASLSASNITAAPGGVASTELTLTTQSWLPAGHYTITVKGRLSGGAEVHRIPLEMDIVPPAGFGMASIYLSPTLGSPGTWITLSGSGFPASTNLTHLYLGPTNAENDWASRLPAIVTNGSGAFTAVLQVPASLPAGMYPIEVAVGNPPSDRRASTQFTLVSSQASFNISLSPMMLQTAPGSPASTSVNVQSIGSSSVNVTLRVEGPPNIQWRFDGGAWQTPKIVMPPIGGTVFSSLEIMPTPTTPMAHYSLAVKAYTGQQEEYRKLELDVGASAGYNMPIFSLNPNNGMTGSNVAFSGSNFPAATNLTSITFGGDNISLPAITTSPQGTFSGAFTVPSTVGGQPIASGTYPVRVTAGPTPAETPFNIYGSGDSFTISASPNYLQGAPGGEPRTSCVLQSLGGASPAVKMAVRGLPAGVTSQWNGNAQSVFTLSTPPGGQSYFELILGLPGMIPMGHYPAVLEGWVDSNQNNAWNVGEKIVRANLELSIMPPQGYGMGMLSLSPTYGQVGDTVVIAGSGFPANTAVQMLQFAQTNILSNNITSSGDGSFSGVFTVPGTAFGMPTGPGMYPVDVTVGTSPNDRRGNFGFQVVAANQKFSVGVSPNWLARPAGETAFANITITSLVATPPSPTVIIRVEGLPQGVTPSFTSTNVTPPVGNMESRELRLTISNSCPMGKYPISVRAYNAAAPSEEMVTNFTLEVTPSSGFMDMGMAMVTLSPSVGSAGSQVTVSGFGFPKNRNLTYIRFGPNDVTPSSVNITTDNATGAFSAVITVPALPSGPHPVEVNVQGTVRMAQFSIMSANDTFSLNVSPGWLAPIPAGDPNGREIAVTVNALPGKTPTVTLSAEGLFTGSGSITEVWNPVSKVVSVSSAGGAATAIVTLRPSQNTPPGAYPFRIVAVDGSNQRAVHMEFRVGPPTSFMGGMMGGVYFPEITLSPNSGPAGTQISYTGTNLPAVATVTSINFAGRPVPLPPGGLTADSNGSFSGSFIVNEAWGLAAGGMYRVEFRMDNAGWSQAVSRDFNLARGNTAFSLEVMPNWIPPIPPGGFGQTMVNVKAVGYTSTNVTLAVMETFGGMGIPGGAQAHWGTNDGPTTSNVTVPAAGQTSRAFYLQGTNPGRYMITIVGWIDSDGDQVLDYNVPSESESAFSVPLDFEIQPPTQFMNKAWMTQNGVWFPEITLNPNVGQAGTKVTIQATDFPAGASLTSLRFAGLNLPVPAGIAADNVTGDFTLVFNVPRTMWGGDTQSGWYDVQVEAQKSGEPPVSIMKPFQVTAADVAFTIRADPNWLPPIPPGGNGSTLIRAMSMSTVSANITLSVNKIPPGVTPAFSSSQLTVPPGGSGSATLTLTPINIPPGQYGAEIKGTATVDGNQKTFYTHLEFQVQPPMQFMNKDWMAQQGVWFPEITLNPSSGPAKTKVTVKATDFPTGATITHLRFAGRELPVPANTTADNVTGELNLVFNVPGDFGIGNYMVEVEAQKAGMPPVFIAKPFFIEDAGVSFKLNAAPGFIPGVPQGASGNTTIFVEATGQALTVNLYVDGLPPAVNATFDSATLIVAPGGSTSTRLTITTGTSTPPGQYPLTIRGVSGGEVRVMPFGLGVTPPASFQMPRFTLEPDFAPAGYTDKKYKVTFSGTGFPASQNVTSLKFGAQPVAIPEGLTTDANGTFSGVFQMPTGLDPGTYDVRVAVATGGGGYIYDSRPFSIRGADAKFILQLSPPYLPPVVQSGNATITVNTRSVGTTTANVTLYVDGLAPGITAAFSPSNIVTVSPGSSGSATLTFRVSPGTPPGPYPVSIRGITGSEAAVVPLGFGVMPNIGAGAGYATITINPPRARPGEHIGVSGAGFTTGNTITLTAAPPGAPTPINITPGTIQVQADGTWATEITVPAAGQVPPGTYIIKAIGGDKDAKSPFSIVPAENADFFLNLSPQFLKVVQGNSGNTTLTLSSRNAFKGAVRFSVGHLAPGVTATFKNTTGSTVGKFTGMPGGIREVIVPTALTPIPGEDLTITTLIEVDAATPIGPYDIGIQAETGTIFRSVPLGLMVVSPGASMVISPMSGPDDTDVRLSGTGFTAGETVGVTFANSNITTVPATVTVAQDGTFTALITAPTMAAGIYSVKVAGAASGTTIDRPFGLMPSAVNTFVLYASPQKVDIPKGGSGTITPKIEPLGSFQSAVTLSVSGLSAIAGATANITPSATITPSIGTPTTATLTINIPSGASEGRYPLVITGTSGAVTQTRNVTVSVVPPVGTADFAINLAPNTVPIGPGSSGNTTVTITAINGFAGTVNLAVTMSDPAATWPAGISYTTANVTPSANTGLGKQDVTFTVSAGTQPGNWTFKVTGTSGALVHSAGVMVICTPSGATITPYASPRLDPTTITASTPVTMTPPWGDKITINGLINDGSEASVITPSTANVTPAVLASLPAGASDMLGRVTNVESSSPVAGVEWNLGFPYNLADLTAARLTEENLKIAYLNPNTGGWTEVTTTVDTTNKIAYASPTHFSSWTLIATPAPPVSNVVSGFGGGGGGGGGTLGVTNITNSVASDGKFIEAVTATSEDARAKLTIFKDTIGKSQTGQRLYSLTIKETTAPSAPPSDVKTIGLIYDIGPGGATFDPPISLTLRYYESQVPRGVAEKNLIAATWDSADARWVALQGTVDPEANAITVKVSHFSAFTILAYTRPADFALGGLSIAPAEVGVGEKVNISVTVTNTGDLTGSYEVGLKIDDVPTQASEIKLDGGDSTTVSFSMTLDSAGKHIVNVGGLTGTLQVRTPKSPATFTTSKLSISPAEVGIGEKVNISVIVANTGEQSGSYQVTLKMGNAAFATKDVTLAGGANQEVIFSTTRDIAGTYTANVDGLSATFIVRAAPARPAEVPAAPKEVQLAKPESPTAPAQPTPSTPPAEPVAPITNLPQVGLWRLIGMVAVGIVIGVVIWRTLARRRAS